MNRAEALEERILSGMDFDRELRGLGCSGQLLGVLLRRYHSLEQVAHTTDAEFLALPQTGPARLAELRRIFPGDGQVLRLEPPEPPWLVTTLKLSAAEMLMVEQWRQQHRLLSRAEAIRQMLAVAAELESGGLFTLG